MKSMYLNFNFGCYVVLIFALSFSLDTHAVFLGFSVLPIRSRIFLSFFCYTCYLFSFGETDTDADSIGSLFCAFFYLSSAAKAVCFIHTLY